MIGRLDMIKQLIRQAQSPAHDLHQQFLHALSVELGASTIMISQELSAVVHRVGCKMITRKTSSQCCPPWKTSEVQALCKQKWSSYSLVRQLDCPTSLAGYFSIWRVMATHLRDSRRCQRASRAA